MDHSDHVALLRPAKVHPDGTWADLGAGSGAFTLALRELAGAQASIYAVDRDKARLGELERAWRMRFGDTENLHLLHADFTGPLNLPALDGLLMANSLHFYQDKTSLLRRVSQLLKPGGRLLAVEYAVDAGNMWVPYPFSFERFKLLAVEAGFGAPRLLATHPSSFLKGFYAAEAIFNTTGKIFNTIPRDSTAGQADTK
jgi:ubiquinone/menaquinone biosynthesis C-methylase UbiE